MKNPFSNMFSKQVVQPQQVKSFSSFDEGVNESFADFLFTGGQFNLYAFECVRLLKKCAPFFDSVSRRSTAFSSIPFQVWDKDENEYEADHPALLLLNSPNPLQTGSSFLKSVASFFDSTGISFIMVCGNPIPLEIYSIPPQNVSLGSLMNCGACVIPKSYTVSTQMGTQMFYLSEEHMLDNTFRYISADGERQLWVIKDFNPEFAYMGQPKAQPLFLQIQQYIEASLNNYSILKRGGRPSIAWVWQSNVPATDPQFVRMKEQMKNYEGSINAGRQVFVDNVKPENVGLNNKDMQFKENLEQVRNEIYTLYGVPLSLVSSSSMTMDNLKVGNKLFWEQAVIPLADFLLDQLTRMLMPMYKTPNCSFDYNPLDIAPLKEMMIDEAKTMSGLYVLSDNEIRTNIGYEATDSGDLIYKPSTLVVSGVDTVTDDNLQERSELRGSPRTSAEDDLEDEDEMKHRMSGFLKATFNADGSRKYTDTQVDLMVSQWQK